MLWGEEVVQKGDSFVYEVYFCGHVLFVMLFTRSDYDTALARGREAFAASIGKLISEVT